MDVTEKPPVFFVENGTKLAGNNRYTRLHKYNRQIVIIYFLSDAKKNIRSNLQPRREKW
jgi:hypothetical protein